jgi:hypothetical protein
MRFLPFHALVIGFFLVLAAPTHADVIGRDRTASLLGTWACTTVRGSSATHTFTKNADGSLSMVNTFSTPAGDTEAIDETYRYVPATSTWTVTTSETPLFGPYEGSAKPWTERRWVIDGHEPLLGSDGTKKDTPVRMQYTDLFPAGFRREFQTQVDGVWRDYSEEVCTS